MENKTEAVRREILKGILDRFNGKGKATIIRITKEKGVYKNFVDDIEVWQLITKFAEFHGLPLTEEIIEIDNSWENHKETTQILTVDKIDKEVPTLQELRDKKKSKTNQDDDEEEDDFLKQLQDEHTKLSKRLLALNKVIEVYKKN